MTVTTDIAIKSQEICELCQNPGKGCKGCTKVIKTTQKGKEIKTTLKGKTNEIVKIEEVYYYL